MVGDLVALSRLQSPSVQVRREDASLRDLVSGVIEQARPVADRQGVRLTGEATQSAPVRVDANEVARAVTNLVANAIRHTRPAGLVQVDVREDDGWAVVQVTDECGGIPAANLPHVFQPGWRGSEGRGPGDGAGAGLGLAITQGVAEGHSGSVSVRNEGDGCVFELRLPSARPGAREDVREQASQQATS